MGLYIFQIIIFQILFLLGYELLLKKETFFTYNRWYLLSTTVIALLLPLIKIEGFSFLFPEEAIANITTVWLPEVFIGEQQNSQNLPAAQIRFRSYYFWPILYFLGFFGSLFRVFRKYQNLNSLFKFKNISEEKEFKVIEVPNSDIACTFYKTVFLGDFLSEAERSQILNHELVHVRQKHSLDLMFFEVLKIVLWFNPLIYIYQSKIAIVHEFIADAAVVKETGKRNYYEQLLNSAFSTRNISFINQFFNHSLTRLTVFGKTITLGKSNGQVKKRIVMLQRSKSKTIAKLKYLVLLPLMLVMLTAVAQSESGDDFAKEVTDTDQIDQEANIKNSHMESSGFIQELAIPFAVVEEKPVFPGCDQENNQARQDCLTQKIEDHVMKNFDLLAIKPYMTPGRNRIVVQFKIDRTGEVTEVRSRMVTPGPDTESKKMMEEEAIRVVESIPQMQPGRHEGKAVGVMYSLPIQLFNAEKEEGQ